MSYTSADHRQPDDASNALPPGDASPSVLVVCVDPMLCGDLSDALDESFEARVQVATCGEDALRLLHDGAYDLVIIDTATAIGRDGWIEEVVASGTPIILIEPRIVAEQVLSALRLGVADVLCQPIDFVYLERVVRNAIRRGRTSRQRELRSRRLRTISSRMVKDRRVLRQRIDVLCKDLVVAYRRLAEKVAADGTPD